MTKTMIDEVRRELAGQREKALPANVKEQVQKLTRSPETARAFLIRAGILDKKGNPSPNYYPQSGK